jgi:hypothetical protein
LKAYRIGYGLVLLMLALSCNPGEDAQEPDFGYDYLPLKVGYYQTYSVEVTRYRQNVPTSERYELKVKMVDSIKNSEGGFTYLLRLQKRLTSGSAWTDIGTNSIRIANNKAIESERNISTLKLMFPLQEGLSWDGNAYNTLGGEQTCEGDRECDIYTVVTTQEKFVLTPSLTFSNSVIVSQSEDDANYVLKDLRKEIYAKGVGLVYKDSTYYQYCKTDDCYFNQFINKGVKYKQVLTAYGFE